MRQMELADGIGTRAKEQRKLQEKRKLEDEPKHVLQPEQHLRRIKVLEATSGSCHVQMPDELINLAHVHFAQGNFALAVKMHVHIVKLNNGKAKSSALKLQKTTTTLDEVRTIVGELKNAIRLFNLLCASSNLHFHGLDEKKIQTHLDTATTCLKQHVPIRSLLSSKSNRIYDDYK
ncbi:protein CTR9 [Sesamum alatum]|uniref:Protein CTR9 n=1 Tax=Sesamum alatum TaxID=300844 RepID=A0AAE1XPM3_9LAMI|nr:protein CTR9 [Sesamum alatum]